MAPQALYNRWRAQTFEDILGQEHITRTLQNQVRAGRVSHAYLFTGVRGTGKTSTARVLAKAVNCLGETDNPPCDQCENCRAIAEGRFMDLIEIDAASNRGIDEIRELRDRIGFVPQQGRYKVYVIDEVHMLTKEAFNALLKTLEEPPEHVIFVLCTTEPHRLPDTIVSRCQRYDFRRAPVSVIVQKLKRICDQEGIDIEEQALEYIARRAEGSFRDAESLLDQLSAYGTGKIDESLLRSVLGTVSAVRIVQLLRCLFAGDLGEGLELIADAMDDGADPEQFLIELIDHLRAMLLLSSGASPLAVPLGRQSLNELKSMAKEGVPLGGLIQVIKHFSAAQQALRTALRPQLPLELAFVESALALSREQPPLPPLREDRQPDTGVPSPPREQAGKKRNAVAVPVAPGEGSEPQSPKPREPEELTSISAQEVSATGVAEQPLQLDWVQGRWQLVLTKMRQRSPQIQAILNSVYPIAVHGDVITLGCEAAFHRNMLSDPGRRALVEEVMRQVLEADCRIECTISEDMGAHRPKQGGSLSQGDLLKGRRAQTSEAKEELLSHPLVQALRSKGGRITHIEIFEDPRKGG